MVYELLFMHHLSFSFFLDKGLSFLSSSFFLTCLSMWHTFFGYASFIFSLLFFDMPKHLAYLLWVCIFYFFSFCIAPYPWHILSESGVIHGHGVLFLWKDGILLTSSIACGGNVYVILIMGV